MSSFSKDGFEIHPAVFTADEITGFRAEASRIQKEAGTACVRGITSYSEIFHQLSSAKKLLSLMPKGLTPVRSILFDKTAKENWPVLWHRDLTIAVKEKMEVSGYGPWSVKNGIPHVQPPLELLDNMATLRFHLDDTPEENGALRVLPQTHLLENIQATSLQDYSDSLATTCECKAGDVLLMSPLILHSSPRTKAPGSRRVIHFEYAKQGDLDSRLIWAVDNTELKQ